jgi:uncharacterized coiled-coil protein SlyX
MKDSFTKELIELAAQSATIKQLNVVIKARDMRILELEDELAIANIEIKDLKQRLKIASDANEHIMKYVKELEFDANSTFQTTTR